MKIKLIFGTIVSGVLFLICYNVYSEYLMNTLWLLYFLPYLISGGLYFILTVIIFRIKYKTGQFISISLGLLILISFLANSEIFKSKKIIEAKLTDEHSAIYMTLRANGQFEINSSTAFSEKFYQGKYLLLDSNRIIFLTKNDEIEIPDTIHIKDKKIFLYTNEINGIIVPVTEYATYFDILINNYR